jgi:hypothetical protein
LLAARYRRLLTDSRELSDHRSQAGTVGVGQKNPGTVYDPELFRRKILARLGTAPLSEIMETAGCSETSASDYRPGKRRPHVSAWRALSGLVGISL